MKAKARIEYSMCDESVRCRDVSLLRPRLYFGDAGAAS